MHMADALVSPSVALSMYAASTVVAAYSIKKVREENNPRKIPLMGIMGAFVFAAQMLNFAIPGTGSSGHLCGSMLLAALLGPEAAFLTMIGILAMQCLLFADGGLLALGANIWNMAFYGCFVGGLLIWRPLMRNGFVTFSCGGEIRAFHGSHPPLLYLLLSGSSPRNIFPHRFFGSGSFRQQVHAHGKGQGCNIPWNCWY